MEDEVKYFTFELVTAKADEQNDPEFLQHPDDRSGHRIIVTNNNLYSIGGYNPHYWGRENDEFTIYPIFRELWKFNLTTRIWMKLKTSGEMPVELASHAALLLGNNLLVHGGTGTPFGYSSSNQLYACNLRTLQWVNIQCNGTLPGEVYGHSLTVVGKYIYMFGGTTGFEYSDDVHKLDLETFIWERIPIDDRKPPDNRRRPKGRYRHEAVTDGEKVFIFGGGRAYATYGFEELDVFNIKENVWEKHTCQPAGSIGFPKPRRCHSCVRYKNNVFICGGYNGAEPFNDLWKMNLTTYQWSKFSQLPNPVYFHSADVTVDGCMYIFGGVNVIDTERNADIYRIWLHPPTLKEQCWIRFTSLVEDFALLGRDVLLEIGIPEDLVSRVC
ncbi:kelch domain-containing protein 10-like [Tubulanus polymorphus]|uniref:kelch domain-containing protein 10-like n=1 Tax=Tubulanus polymorphus TaxID=672921 RepID=UPI003DA46552